MREDESSRTSVGAALLRAAHQLLDDPPLFRDGLALEILPPETRAVLEADPRRFDQGRGAVRLRAFLAVRSRVAEDALGEAVAAGLRQYVVLGAGFDTFGLRNAGTPLRVFEVDHPSTQASKVRRIRQARIPVPFTLSFVGLDFDREDLASRLVQAGLSPDKPAFFAWLGVTPYLGGEAIWRTLHSVAQLTESGGGIVFDYAVPADRLTPPQRRFALRLAARVSTAGEPFRSVLRPEDLAAGLHALGFRSVEDLAAPALNARYFAGRTDGLRVGGAAHIIIARRVL